MRSCRLPRICALMCWCVDDMDVASRVPDQATKLDLEGDGGVVCVPLATLWERKSETKPANWKERRPCGGGEGAAGGPAPSFSAPYSRAGHLDQTGPEPLGHAPGS